MSQPFAVAARLSPLHLAEFHAQTLVGGATVRQLAGWCRERGYTISYGAVESYVGAIRGGSYAAMRAILGLGNDAGRRERIRDLLDGIQGNELLALSLFANYVFAIAQKHYGHGLKRRRRPNRKGLFVYRV